MSKNTNGIELVGAGLSRTGTRSLQAALEILGYKCCHGFTIREQDNLVNEWNLVLNHGRKPDFDKLYQGYDAAVDVPASCFYADVALQNPNVKVILTTRDSSKWHESVMGSLHLIDYDWSRVVNNFLTLCPRGLKFHNMAVAATYQVAGGMLQFRNRERAVAAFEAWSSTVQATVPMDRLLVFDVAQGWEPLCNFLDKPIPRVPFPRINEGATFKNLLEDQRKAARAKLLSIGCLVLGVGLSLLK